LFFHAIRLEGALSAASGISVHPQGVTRRKRNAIP